MSNRFEHLKKKIEKEDLSKEDFIKGAEEEDVTIQAKPPKVAKKNILLSVSGRMNREKDCGKPVLTYLKKDIEKDIKLYCHGNKALIINYLIRRGLDDLIKEGNLVLHMEDYE